MGKDEKTLYDIYKKKEQKYATSKGEKDPKKDRELMGGFTAKIPLWVMRLKDPDVTISTKQKYVIAAKNMYVQYVRVRARSPEFVTPPLTKAADELLKAICKSEAEMIGMLRLQEPGGARIDIRKILEKPKNQKRLNHESTTAIIRDAINAVDSAADCLPILYIADTGKKFHREDCPYCKGRYLATASLEMIRLQNLTPCKCLAPIWKNDGIDRTCVTAFIDESLHNITWNETGRVERSGNYSYILSWGKLANESELLPEATITKGIGYTEEQKHTEQITETAIGKVLFMLAFDYDYMGAVRIYTDNLGAAQHWESIAKYKRFANLFTSVEVIHIPREKNTRADKMCRDRMLLNISRADFDRTVKQRERVIDLQQKLERIKAEQNDRLQLANFIGN